MRLSKEMDIIRRAKQAGMSRREFIRLGGTAAAAAAFLAACGDDTADTTAAPATTAAATTAAPTTAAPTTTAAPDSDDIGGEITLWAWGAGLEGEVIQQRIDYFNTKYPNVQVNWEPLAANGYEEYPQLLARFAAGNAPDVMRVLNFQLTQLTAEGEALLDLDDYIARDAEELNMGDFIPTTVEGTLVNGKAYGLPDNTEPYVIYYNRDAFNAAGLEDPQVLFQNGEWNEEAFTNSIDALIGNGMRFGVSFESWNYDTFCFMGGGTIINENLEPTIDQGASPQMLGYFAQLIADGKSPNPVVAGGTHLEAFRNQQTGMYLMGPWWYGALAGTVDFDYDVTALPSFNGVRAGKLELGSLSLSSQSKNPEAAWAFAKTVTDTRGLEIWSQVATPTRRSALEAAGFNDEQWKKDAVAMVEAGTWTPFTTKGFAVDTAAAAALDLLWAGETTAEEATADAATRIAEALA